MTPENALKPSTALNGVQGVHLVPHSPFAYEEIKHDGDFHESTYGRSDFSYNQRLRVQKVWQQRPACLRPIHGCMNGDKHLAERVANVLTSLPFIALGIQAPRKNLNCKLYANSLIGVGIASSAYHASRGKLRKYLRWADYTMIATASVVKTRVFK
ncbi:uncharacterized protein LOC111404401 [Olea europaea var. sylvestris]|uniref:uncharacterized protein LOC111404401 n=1 Tax=Olea europaea var. sylvestris TaxID=158386 RepID=UPI000C1CCCE3|nr:uncharacterized protein LOC111404401 [Olea europaea var. sylvestris]